MSGVRVRPFWVGIVVAMLLTALVPGDAALAAAGGPRDPLGATAGAATTRSWIVTLKPGRNPATRARTLSRSAGGRSGRTFTHALNGFVFRGTVKAAAALRRDPAVRSVVLNRTVHIVADGIPTGVARIRANHPTDESAASLGFTGAGVKVAILDTGIDLTHPDLVPNLDTQLGSTA